MYEKYSGERKRRGLGERRLWQPLYRILLGAALIVLAYVKLTPGSLFSKDVFMSAFRGSTCHRVNLLIASSIPQCPAQTKIAPANRTDITEKNVNKLFKSEAFHKLSIDRLAGAIQIPTETFQDMGRLGEDKRWDNFYKLEEYFRKTFPLM